MSCFLFGCSSKNEPQQVFSNQKHISNSEATININTGSVNDLEKIPHIGAKLAQKILEHRHTYGKFRKAEHLMLIEGISDNQFRKIKSLVKVE